MTGLGIKVDARDAERKLARFRTDIGSRTLLKIGGLRLLRWIDQNFKQEGAEKKWKALAPSTVAGRRKNSSRILQDTGRLRQSFVSRIPSEADFKALTDQKVEVGSNDERAEWHHGGTSPYVIRPRKAKALRFRTSGGGFAFSKRVRHPGLVARPLIPSSPLAERMFFEAIDATIAKAAAKASER